MSQPDPAPRSAQRADLRRRLRTVLAGPCVFVCAALVICSGALWLPDAPAPIDHIVLPILLFPASWASLFCYASVAPDVALPAIGQWPAFLVRLHGIAVAGWLLALSLAGARSGHAPAS
jgi:hypothetical protein